MKQKEMELLLGKAPERTLEEIKKLGKLVTKKSLIGEESYEVYEITTKSGFAVLVEEWYTDGTYAGSERSFGF